MIENELMATMGDQRGLSAADRLCQGCVTLLGVDVVAISLFSRGDHIGTCGTSAAAAREYDEVSFISGEGPCPQAAAQQAPVLVADLAAPDEVRWPGYGPAMLDHQIHGVYAIPIMVAGYTIGVLNAFQAQPTELTVTQVMGLLVAAEVAQMPVLDVLTGNALAEPGTDAWNDMDAVIRPEVSQATGMVMAQLHMEAPDALVRLRAHAYATGRSATDVAHDILRRRLELDYH